MSKINQDAESSFNSGNDDSFSDDEHADRHVALMNPLEPVVYTDERVNEMLSDFARFVQAFASALLLLCKDNNLGAEHYFQRIKEVIDITRSATTLIDNCPAWIREEDTAGVNRLKKTVPVLTSAADPYHKAEVISGYNDVNPSGVARLRDCFAEIANGKSPAQVVVQLKQNMDHAVQYIKSRMLV